MSMVARQISWGVALSLSVLVFVILSITLEFSVPIQVELWEREVMDIPFLLFVPSVSLAIGLLIGLISGLFYQKQLHTLDSLLHEVEEGRPITSQKTPVFPVLEGRILKIQKLLAEQARVAQNLANEKAEDQENRIQEIISQERNRLARELHDSVSQQLFAASMMMSAITEMNQRDGSDATSTKQLKMVEEMIHQSQLEMRALLLHLRPVALKGKTLQEGMEELLVELSQKVSMQISWKVEEFALDKGVEDHLFRILQESVSNTLRHSKAEELEVRLMVRDDWIILRVVDDGVGFDVSESKAGAYGLQNMQERAIEIGGTCKIISVKNKGTRLEVKVPLMRKGETI